MFKFCMKAPLLFFFLVIGGLVNAQNQVSSETRALANCVKNSTSEKDRATVMNFFASAMLQNPTLADELRPTDAFFDQQKREFLTYLEETMTLSCLAESRAAYKIDGTKAFTLSFSTVIVQTMKDLTSNLSSALDLEEISAEFDDERIKKLIGVD